MVLPVRAPGTARTALVGHHHDARYDARYAPLGGGGDGAAGVTITGTEGVTVVESPANTFALGLTASPDANNTIEIRGNGIYAASGAIPPEYVTDAELAAALTPYATDADLTAHAAAGDPHPGYALDSDLATHGGAADPHAGYVLESLVDAKGDLLVGSADNTPARLAVGPNGQFLTAQSGQATGLQWAANPVVAHEAAGDPHPTYATDTDLATHAAAANPHPVYATDADLSNHAAAADPHTGYVLEGLATAKGDLLAATAASTLARLGVGSNGQFLTAQSGQATGLQWAADPTVGHVAAADPHTGYVLESLLTTKGDLYAATAPNTPARLGVGSDTQVLTADSSQATGLRWATPASGGMTNPMTTKGDLIAGGTAGVATRLAVGPDGYILTADGASALSVKWAAPAVTQAALDALTARVATLEAQLPGHTHLSGTIAAAGGTAVMP